MENSPFASLFAQPEVREPRQKTTAAKQTIPGTKRVDPRKLWDNYREIAYVQKSDRLRFVIAACTREGYRCVNIREFYYVKRDDVWRPGRDGIMFPIVAPLHKTRKPDPNNPPKLIHPMSEMMLALAQAAEYAAEMDLEDPENEVWLKPKTKETDK